MATKRPCPHVHKECPLSNIRWNVGEVTLASRCKKDEITITEFKAPALNRRERHLYGPVQPLKSKDFFEKHRFQCREYAVLVWTEGEIFMRFYIWTGSKFAEPKALILILTHHPWWQEHAGTFFPILA